jgi:hypothetical protein
MDNSYTLFGFDAETNMVPFTAERLTVDEAKEFARENGLGSFFITPSTREQFPDYRIIHYLPNGDGTHRPVVHCEWLARTFSFTQKFPAKGSALYEEVYGKEEA